MEQWQGGDIVIFEKHIGIVSDRRNWDGVPYVIHHNDPWQTAYEQDILEKRRTLWDITVSPNNGIKSGSTALGKPA